MDQHLLRGFINELQAPMVKQALIERLVRLAATDVEDLPGVKRFVKSTPRMVMRKRSPEELAQLQHGVQGFFDSYEKPAIAKAKSVIEKRVSHPKAQKLLTHGAEAVIRNPELALTELSPVPGTGLAWLGAKKGLERAIDRLAPVPPR
jgi:hypothetical protein